MEFSKYYKSIIDATGIPELNLEKGKYNPSLKLAYDISRVFKLRIEDVFAFD